MVFQNFSFIQVLYFERTFLFGGESRTILRHIILNECINCMAKVLHHFSFVSQEAGNEYKCKLREQVRLGLIYSLQETEVRERLDLHVDNFQVNQCHQRTSSPHQNGRSHHTCLCRRQNVKLNTPTSSTPTTTLIYQFPHTQFTLTQSTLFCLT